MNAQLWLLALSLAKLVVHLATINQYGYFRDELYYLACSRHLAWGYVDHPPLSIALLAAARTVFGDSLLAIRLVPAIAGAATVYLTGRLARELGGGTYVQVLAAIAVLAAPQYLGTHRYYSMNSLEVLGWTAAAYLVLRCLREGATVLWLALGAVLGLGILNKLSALWLCFGLLAGLAASQSRGVLRTRGPWLAAFVAAAMAIPHLFWQIAHGWPTLEFLRQAAAHKVAQASVPEFLMSQVLIMNPASLPVWAFGLAWALRETGDRRIRVLGVCYLAVLVILLAYRTAKPDYLAAAYTMLFAAGGVALERGFARRGLAWLRLPLPAAMILFGLILLPLAVPILPVDSFARYQRALGIKPPQAERLEAAELPQHYADMFGWEEMAATVGQVYQRLSPEDRVACAVVTQNYGEAGAIDHFGRRYGLPRAISGHNNYWLWGLGDWNGDVLIVVGGSREAYARLFERVDRVATIRCERCMPYERDLPVYLARGLKVSLTEYWREEKRFI